MMKQAAVYPPNHLLSISFPTTTTALPGPLCLLLLLVHITVFRCGYLSGTVQLMQSLELDCRWTWVNKAQTAIKTAIITLISSSLDKILGFPDLLTYILRIVKLQGPVLLLQQMEQHTHVHAIK